MVYNLFLINTVLDQFSPLFLPAFASFTSSYCTRESSAGFFQSENEFLAGRRLMPRPHECIWNKKKVKIRWVAAVWWLRQKTHDWEVVGSNHPLRRPFFRHYSFGSKVRNGHSPANLANSSTRWKFAIFGKFEYSPKWSFSEMCHLILSISSCDQINKVPILLSIDINV